METLKYKVIKSDEQYFEYVNRLEELVSNGLDCQEAIDEYELLYLLIRTWDDEHRLAPDMDPIELIKSLMKVHGLSQNALAKIGGIGKSYISEILNYKKRMSKEVIRNFADHFNIQQEALNKHYRIDGEAFIEEGEFYSANIGKSSGSKPVDYSELFDGLIIENETKYNFRSAA
ncbi:MAG: helix-turn-helix domain-containing protein [Balneolaceae bacterium]